MPSFCAGYFPGDLLFEVDGLLNTPKPVPSFVANTFSILTRGAPTRPSPKILKSMFPSCKEPETQWVQIKNKHLCLISKNTPMWCDTILGSDDGDNPALHFFEHVLAAELPKFAFIRKLLIPEYPLFEKLNAPMSLRSGVNEEKVDFYLPQANLVIEIDGSQHLDLGQKSKDISRDRFLRRFGIETLRLTTRELKKPSAEFYKFFDQLNAHCESSFALSLYKDALDSQRLPTEHSLTASIRLQIAMICAISHGQLKLDGSPWHLDVTQDFELDLSMDWVQAALEELFHWFSLFARLAHLDFQRPKIRLSANGLRFDIRLFDRPDDRILQEKVITVRTSPVQSLPFIANTKPDLKILDIQNLGISSFASLDKPDYALIKPNSEDLSELTFQVFGHEAFRPGQEALILNALSGQKSLGLMPTGGGKSLCFQVPALLRSATTVAVVPIKALGRDHCAELDAAGFSGRSINIDSDMPKSFLEAVVAPRIAEGAIRFVFVSPERFQTDFFRNLLTNLIQTDRLGMFVIDEVHCMSEWGHDFRTSYLTLPGTLKEIAKEVPVMGLTATASVNVLQDIQAEFEIPDSLVAYEMHRSRTELNFSIKQGPASFSQVSAAVKQLIEQRSTDEQEPVHIFTRYVNGRSGVQSVAEALIRENAGLRVGIFSGSEPEKFDFSQAFTWLRSPTKLQSSTYETYKSAVQGLWKANELDVVVTTKAFGMGVNKANVRHTLHAGMPSSMEAFYQEAGRAGRDRMSATCHMLVKPEQDDAAQIFEKLRTDLTLANIEKYLKYDTSGKELYPNDRGDLRAQLWFLSQGVIDSDKEVELVVHAIKLLSSDEQNEILLKARDFETLRSGSERLQLTLYRIYQMGLIGPWTVVDWGRPGQAVQACLVTKTNACFEDACASVKQRIQSIDGKSAEISSIDRLIKASGECGDWRGLSVELILWVRRKHWDSRLQSTWNLYSKSVQFDASQAATFREELEAFFKVDKNVFELAALRDASVEDAVSILNGLLKNMVKGDAESKSQQKMLSLQIARLLEGTQDSKGLNLGAAILLLLTNTEAALEAENRFNSAVGDGALEFWNSFGQGLLNKVASLDDHACDMIGEWLMRFSPGRRALIGIQKGIPAKAVEEALFIDLASELTAII